MGIAAILHVNTPVLSFSCSFFSPLLLLLQCCHITSSSLDEGRCKWRRAVGRARHSLSRRIAASLVLRFRFGLWVFNLFSSCPSPPVPSSLLAQSISNALPIPMMGMACQSAPVTVSPARRLFCKSRQRTQFYAFYGSLVSTHIEWEKERDRCCGYNSGGVLWVMLSPEILQNTTKYCTFFTVTTSCPICPPA